MTIGQFADAVRAHLPYPPNDQQLALIQALARFLAGMHGAPVGPSVNPAFIINGYAGTGKTSIVGALVRALRDLNIDVVLMAPTGRAAKVLATGADLPASTIHRRIYRHSLYGGTPPLRVNNSVNTVYIVDEASMIGDASSGHDLLADLLEYVFAGTGSRLILSGDTAQLPPVGDTVSPAMNPDTLRAAGLKVSRATITAIARQGARSGILANAVSLRRAIATDPHRMPRILTGPFKDVSTVTHEDLPEAIDSAYRRHGIEETIIITRSNRRATDFNRAIRAQVLYLEEELAKGEPLMVVKNNYVWTRRVKGLDFIANGDIVVVDKILATEARYGARFADVILSVPDSDITFEAKIFLETLVSPNPAMTSERMAEISARIMRDMSGDEAADPTKALANNPYLNALQVKYAYAVTCHKAQGGQWAKAFVDIAYVNAEAIDAEFYRWLYTATTRAAVELTYITDPDPKAF